MHNLFICFNSVNIAFIIVLDLTFKNLKKFEFIVAWCYRHFISRKIMLVDSLHTVMGHDVFFYNLRFLYKLMSVLHNFTILAVN